MVNTQQAISNVIDTFETKYVPFNKDIDTYEKNW